MHVLKWKNLFLIIQLCVSTSVWNCFTVRSWGSRRLSWRKLRWTWWVCQMFHITCAEGACHWEAVTSLYLYRRSLCSVYSRGNMSFLQRSWVVNWLRLFTETQLGKSKVGYLNLCTHISIDTLQINKTEFYCWCVSWIHSQVPNAFFLICPTEAEFVISLLHIAAIFDFTKDLQELILQEWAATF